MLGVVATGLVIGGYVPQIVHLVKERCTVGISIPAFVVWCLASLLFLIHATVIGDSVFVGVQTVNLIAGGLIVGFCKKYEGGVCPFHRELYGGRRHVRVLKRKEDEDACRQRSGTRTSDRPSRKNYARSSSGRLF